ncbi:hypothetical protein A2U01_0070280, partial [Trifolium medium]|nr:hypothetical protein [Trifolium medium]
NCCEKTVVFPKPEENSQLMSSKEVAESLKEHAEMFVMFASLKVELRWKSYQLFANFPMYFQKMCLTCLRKEK